MADTIGPETKGPRARGQGLDLKQGSGRTFLHVLLNTLFGAVINFTVWFAVTFWVYIETQSVFATGMIAGIFLIATASTGVWFGSLVDHHHKKHVMMASSAVSWLFYLLAFGLYILVPADTFKSPASPLLWCFIVVVMLGVIAGNIRTIALPTLVTLLIPEDQRDRANGLVGTTSGVSFLVTSVISGLLVAAGGMFYVLLLGIAVLAVGMVHLSRVRVDEPAIVAAEGADDHGKVDLRGTIKLVRSVPGLMALIAFSCFNNFLGGAFMALMDAYGLSLMSVSAWGLLWGVLSTGVIIGGLLVAKVGLGSHPLRILLLVNLLLWTVTMLFPLRSSVIILAIAMFVYMLVMPFAEAAEQTILQRVVPYQRQGRVFGFAQSVEQAASPLTAFLIGPITQFAVIPWMTDGGGARAIGWWFGTGQARGIALVFVICGVIGVIATMVAFASPQYRRLSKHFKDTAQNQPTDGQQDPPDVVDLHTDPAGRLTGQ